MVLEALSFGELMVPAHPLAFLVYIISSKPIPNLRIKIKKVQSKSSTFVPLSSLSPQELLHCFVCVSEVSFLVLLPIFLVPYGSIFSASGEISVYIGSNYRYLNEGR